MADLFVISLAAFVFDRVDLLALLHSNHIRADSGAGNVWRADLGFTLAADEEYAVEADGFDRCFGPVEFNNIAGCYFVLPSTIINNRVHWYSKGLREGEFWGNWLKCQAHEWPSVGF